ncbi:choice-of-anchor A family protein [Streptomyces sp. AC627_RSS907]|uniref:choice-of-anchor A family protein n=1 Tax=Streptomyces sp. AC627_RSS907 TaxID=2823684 RepID=UPI001C215CED|nr:choice-of-anchor A family protein [Streptomyces sp. AC627_RSS907]
MRKREKTTTRKSATAALALSLGFIGCGGIYAASPAIAAGQSASCPTPGKTPGIGHNPTFTDNNVSLFAGGDYTADGGTAEAEGLLVVKGDATFAKHGGGVFNVGRVGAGSGILPVSGDVMLAVGGGLSIDKGTTVDVGHGLTAGPRYGGSVRVGGALDDQGELRTNGGSLAEGMGQKDALGTYAAFDATLRKESSSLGSLKTTGTAAKSGGSVTFTSTGAGKGGLQVFEISAADLDGASTFLFKSIPAGDSVVVNVTGSQGVKISPMAVGFNDDRVDLYSSAKFGEAASRILYNFEKSPSVTLGGGGNFMGSILAPDASADITASTNGRLYFGKDVRTHGSGNESHNYPWNGSPAFECKSETTVPPAPPTKPSEPARPDEPTKPEPEPSTTPDSPSPSAPATQPSQPDRPSESAEQPAAEPSASTPAPRDDDKGLLATTGAGPTTLIAVAAAAVIAAGVAMFAAARRRRRT